MEGEEQSQFEREVKNHLKQSVSTSVHSTNEMIVKTIPYGYFSCITYCIAGYIGGNNVWRIAGKRKKIAFGGYKFGGYWFMRYDHHAFSAVGAIFNIGGVTRYPPIRQI